MCAVRFRARTAEPARTMEPDIIADVRQTLVDSTAKVCRFNALNSHKLSLCSGQLFSSSGYMISMAIEI